MKKRYLKSAFFAAISLLLIGCATQKPVTGKIYGSFQPVDLNEKLQAGGYEQKVDNFMVILDKSGSMGELYRGQTKLTLARAIVSRMNQTIPDIRLNGSLIMFGRIATFCTRTTKLLYGPTSYSKAGFEGGLNNVDWARGMSPLECAINTADRDLQSLPGQTALIIVSDGKELNSDLVLKTATDMKRQYGDRLCIFTVLVGKDPEGSELLKKVAKVSQCGVSVNADQIISKGFMANFVEKIFLKKVGIVEKIVEVEKRVIAVDSDGDGVNNDVDQCPNTPRGIKVNKEGCWEAGIVNFDFDKWNIKPGYYPILDQTISVLRSNPYLRMKIEGNTDSIGTDRYNMGLSEKRAVSVKGYLVKKGIEKSRLSIIGYGLTRPIATNSTPEGRALNRRTVLKQTP